MQVNTKTIFNVKFYFILKPYNINIILNNII